MKLEALEAELKEAKSALSRSRRETEVAKKFVEDWQAEHNQERQRR